jgi:hypothetical protein
MSGDLLYYIRYMWWFRMAMMNDALDQTEVKNETYKMYYT